MVTELAKRAGADCVKFQTFSAERVVTAAAPKAEYQLRVTDRTESQLATSGSLHIFWRGKAATKTQ